MKLETKRLIIRTPKIRDVKDIVEGIGDSNISSFLSSVPHPYKKKDALFWINKSIKNSKGKNPSDIGLVIELKSEKKVIGGSGLHHVDWYNLIATTGSWISKEYQRKAVITEAKIAINDFAFNKLKLRRLESEVYPSNKASNSMIKKVGYKLEGKKRKSMRAKATGKIHDANVYGLLKEDWKKSRPKLIKSLKKKLK